MACYICENLEAGDTLYASSDWDGGLGFDYIRDIQYCPVCGRKLRAEQTEPSDDPEQFCREHKCTYYRPQEGGCTKNIGDCPFYTEPTTEDCSMVETMSCQECKHWIYDDRWGWFCPLKSQDECRYEPKDKPQTDCTTCDQVGRCERGRAVECPLTDCQWK